MKNIIRTLLAAGVGLTLGWVCGQAGRRKNAEAMVDVNQPLPSDASTDKVRERQLRQIRSVVNDIHKRILTVSKGLQKPAL
jgi:hypothetical protein